MQTLNIKNQHPILLFSAELFSDTNPNTFLVRNFASFYQPPRHLSGVKPPRQLSGGKPLKSSTILEEDVGNKPNFKNAQIFATPYPESLYKKFIRRAFWRTNPNKPNSNPFLPPKTNPKPKTNPIQTQSKPNFPAGQATQKRLRNYEIPKGKK